MRKLVILGVFGCAVLIIFLLFRKPASKVPLLSFDESPFERKHFDERIGKLKERMKKLKLDAYIISDPKSIYYFSGSSYIPLERPFFIILQIGDNSIDPIFFLVPKLEEEHMIRKQKLRGRVFSYWEYPSKEGSRWMDKIKDILSGSEVIGVEQSLTVENYQLIKEYLPESKIMILSDTYEIRYTKSEREIQMIRKTSNYADLGLEMMLQNAYYGQSALEVFTEMKNGFERFLKLREIPKIQFEPLQLEILNFIFPSPYSALPHGVPPLSSLLESGPHIALSYLQVNGYAAECERTFFLTQPTDREREVFQDMLIARNKALDILKPGVHCEDIDLIAKNYLIEKGYEKYLLHRVGHGIGHDNHEGPWISEGCKTSLEEGMVISIEPGIYIPDIGGFRHSDTVLITKTGYELLTIYPVDLESLIFKPSIIIEFKKKIWGSFLKWYLNVDKLKASDDLRKSQFEEDEL